jgi:hypothetical protein
MSGLTVAICPIVNVRAVAFRYDRLTSTPAAWRDELSFADGTAN